MKTALMAAFETAPDKTPGLDPMLRLQQFAIEQVTAAESQMREWKAELAIYEKQSDNDFGHRLTGQSDPKLKTTFDHSNESLNMVRGVARYMRGRCEGDLFGGSPWFNVKAEGLADMQLADGMQKHFDFKLRQAKYRAAGKENIGTVVDLGTGVLKSTWKVVSEPYWRMSSVFHGPDDNPVMTTNPSDPLKGDYLEEGHPALSPDPTSPDPDSALYQPPDEPAPAPDPTAPPDPTQPALDPTAPPPDPNAPPAQAPMITPPKVPGKMKPRLIMEENVKFKGLSTETVPYKNLLVAPFNVKRLEDADLVGHYYSVSYLDLKAHYDPDGNDPALADVWLKLSTWYSSKMVGDQQPKGTAEMPSTGTNTGNAMIDDMNPSLTIHELRLRFAPDGKAVRRIYQVIHVESESIIYADFLGNMTPGGDLDMHAVTINKVPGRWYGRGYYKVYEMLQRLIDRGVNNIEYHNDYSSDPIKVLNKSVCEETQFSGDIKQYKGKLFTRKGNADPAAKLLELIVLPDLNDRTWELNQLYMQILQQDSGVTAAAQGDPGALPSVSTATGTNAILASGSTMHQLVIDDLREGFEENLTYTARLLYSRQDADETFSYLQGDQATAMLMSLQQAKTLQQLYLHVALSLTRIRNQEQRQSAQSFLNSAVQYFGLPPQAQIALRPAYIQLGKGYEMDNVDGMFPLPQLAPPPMPGQQPPGEPPAASPPVGGGGTTPVAPPPAAEPLVIPNTGANPSAPIPTNVVPGAPQPQTGGFLT